MENPEKDPEKKKKAPKKKTAPKKGGAKTLYKEEFVERAHDMTLLGATNEDLARVFGVNTTTIWKWRKAHPRFENAIREGKEYADAKVTKSLFQRAMGYTVPEQVVKVVSGEIVTVNIEKNYPPETLAIIFWLKNRRPDLWRDRVEQNTNVKISKTDPLDELTVEELRKLAGDVGGDE